MKFVLLGMGIILFGMTIVIAYSSLGLADSSGITFGLAVSSVGVLSSILGVVVDGKSEGEK
ncbi:hypothetical protein [Exiguobacterium sp. s80]|uniref:hypothetical protein n=1 Tax=Exiguobacterium sp. s80 TaxID=2751209 RepID=UPI001BE6AB57|nr:hypothetical protein [Exiguobacterium sp. s80]